MEADGADKSQKQRVRNCFRVKGNAPLNDLHRLLKAIGRGVYVLVNNRSGQSLFVHSSQALEQILEVTGSPLDSTAVEPQAVYYFHVEGVATKAAAESLQTALVTSPGSLVNGAYMDVDSRTLVVFTNRPEPGYTPTLALSLVLDMDFATVDGLGEVEGGVLFGLSAIEAEDQHLIRMQEELETVPGVAQAVFSAEEMVVWISLEEDGTQSIEETRERIRQAVRGCGYKVVDHHDRIFMFQKPFSTFFEVSGECDVQSAAQTRLVDSALLEPVSSRTATTTAVLRSLERMGYHAAVKGSREVYFEVTQVKCNYCIRRLKVELEALRKFLQCHMLLSGTGFYLRLGGPNEDEAVGAVLKVLGSIGVPPEGVKYTASAFPSGAGVRPHDVYETRELIHLRLKGRKEPVPVPPPNTAFPTLKLKVSALTCPVCAALVEASLLRDPRIVQAIVQVSPTSASALVQLALPSGTETEVQHRITQREMIAEVQNVIQKFRYMGYSAEQDRDPRADPQQNSALLMQALMKRDKINGFRDVIVTVTKEFEPDTHTLRSMFPFLRPRCAIIEAHHYSEPPGTEGDALQNDSPELYRCSSSSRSFVHVSSQPMLVRKSKKMSPRRRSTWTETSDDESSTSARGRPGASRSAKETIQLSLFASTEDPDASDSGSESFATPPVGPQPPPTDFHLVVKDSPDESEETAHANGGGPVYYFESAWTFWFDVTVDVKAEHRTKEEMQAMLQNLGSFSTVQGFWSYWNNLNVTKLRDGCNLKLFKKGIPPLWEDPANNQGGRWMARSIPKEQRFKIWSNIVFAMIGEQLPSDGTEICGVVLSTKTSGDVIELWVNGCSPANRVANCLASALRNVVFPENDRKNFYFRPHAVYEAYKRNHRGGRRKHKAGASENVQDFASGGSSNDLHKNARVVQFSQERTSAHGAKERQTAQQRQQVQGQPGSVAPAFQQQAHALAQIHALAQQRVQQPPPLQSQQVPVQQAQSLLPMQLLPHQYFVPQAYAVNSDQLSQFALSQAVAAAASSGTVAPSSGVPASAAQLLLTQEWRSRNPDTSYSVLSDMGHSTSDCSADPLSREASARTDLVDATSLLPHQLQVKQWLESHHVGEYFLAFLANGYDDMEAVYDLDEPELDFMQVKRGHKKRILTAIGKGGKLDAAPTAPAPMLPPKASVPFEGRQRPESERSNQKWWHQTQPEQHQHAHYQRGGQWQHTMWKDIAAARQGQSGSK